MNYLFKFLPAFVVTAVLCASCKKYLDVQPADQMLESTVFSSGSSTEQALNGIYVNLATPALYGGNLTSTTVDAMAQYYALPANTNPYYTVSNYTYTDATAQATLDAVWSGSYNTVLNLNQFIVGVQDAGNVLTTAERNLMLGEAHGLRAFTLFDVLRLFGPVYATDSTHSCIPYPVAPALSTVPLLPANVVMDSVIHDLQTASALLSNDPVIGNGVQPMNDSGTTASNFFLSRNKRMNYYAVNALLARVLMYRGDKVGALNSALAVISGASAWFPWSPSALSLPGTTNPDRIFSSEVLFGLENIGMATEQSTNFVGNNYSPPPLAPLPDILNSIYEGNLNDYRYRINWSVNPVSSLTYKTFVKYEAVSQFSPNYNLQPLLRISEMYYIAAECTADPGQAISYLNTVRFNRGLPDLSQNAVLSDELTKEYQKEFWGEGQLFFYYKRLGMPQITGGTDGNPISMGSANYVVPLPLSETQYR
jgi:starch-binding outer membrane protein, SusD/RagB family